MTHKSKERNPSASSVGIRDKETARPVERDSLFYLKVTTFLTLLLVVVGVATPETRCLILHRDCSHSDVPPVLLPPTAPHDPPTVIPPQPVTTPTLRPLRLSGASYNCVAKDGAAASDVAARLRQSIETARLQLVKIERLTTDFTDGFIIQGGARSIHISVRYIQPTILTVSTDYAGQRSKDDNDLAEDSSADSADRAIAVMRNELRALVSNPACVEASRLE